MNAWCSMRQDHGTRRGRGAAPDPEDPLVVVMGDVDLLRPLVLADIPCVVFAPPGNPVRWSRQVRGRLPWIDGWTRSEELVDALVGFAGRQPTTPVLMPQSDPDLLVISRNRERLAGGFRFALPDADLVEALVDKSRFIELAQRLDLPVPPARRLVPVPEALDDLDLRFPLVIKPALRQDDLWHSVGLSAKALHLESRAALEGVWPRIVDLGVDVLAQEAVAGPETSIESYHAYVDFDGRLVAGFTGRKIRTRPSRYGHSTAVEITGAQDVADLGQAVLSSLDFTGVAKLDFKRAADGSLHLLEINPRFTLWHHVAALAGMNLPAAVYADLTGRPRPVLRPARAGVRWCKPPTDVLAVRDEGGSIVSWARWAIRCEALYGMSWGDPLPVFPGWAWAFARRHLVDALGRPNDSAAH